MVSELFVTGFGALTKKLLPLRRAACHGANAISPVPHGTLHWTGASLKGSMEAILGLGRKVWRLKIYRDCLIQQLLLAGCAL